MIKTDKSRYKKITWDDQYLLNVPILDKQHKQFFVAFEKLNRLNPPDLNSYDKIMNVVNSLFMQSINHFATEEALMLKALAPNYEVQLIQHNFFLIKIAEFKFAFNEHNATLLSDMIVFMRKWFIIHITDNDAKSIPIFQKYTLERSCKISKQITHLQQLEMPLNIK